MEAELRLKQIAHIENDFTTKFGVPRQSGLVKTMLSRIVFEPEYRNVDALRGLEGFSHIWLIWEFSEAVRDEWSPTVRPPRLGGNARMGVFATRSPFRPNPLGLSAVKLEKIVHDTCDGAVLHISGADLMNGTPIYDIKPYIAYADSYEEASGGFTDTTEFPKLKVEISEQLKVKLPDSKLETLCEILSCDPRPTYQRTTEKEYGMKYAEYDIHFLVKDNILTVIDIK